MSYKTVYDVLTTRLNTVSGLPRLQLENIRVDLGSGTTAWSRATLLPSTTNIETVGPNGYSELRGLLQIDLFYPADKGYASSFTMVDSILDKFIPGTILTSDVIIQNSYMMSSQNLSSMERSMTNYHMICLMVEWSLYKQRNTIT